MMNNQEALSLAERYNTVLMKQGKICNKECCVMARHAAVLENTALFQGMSDSEAEDVYTRLELMEAAYE